MSKPIFFTLGCAVLSGCMSMTGLTENAKFACKAPAGTTCTSVSGVYANIGNSPGSGLPARQPYASAEAVGGSAPLAGAAVFPILAQGMPIRSQPRMLRLWMAPWRDEDDTLHDQTYLYVMVDPGKWLVERSRDATVQKTMTRLRPLGGQRAASSPAPAPETQPSTGQLINVRNNAAAQQAARETAVVPSGVEEEK